MVLGGTCLLRGALKSHCQSYAPRRAIDQQDDDAPPPPPPPHLTPHERASVDMLAGITRLLERQLERPEKSHEEDVAGDSASRDPRSFSGLQIR
ncbi:hypothetical protein F511_41298 [Dorcoceras hygrometricum]|uniref:Uncharacterized protein n=1 Tax=Dorcoceras hygrometricum TaxID=472368 RepID=A0A2Z7A0R4_9LAMI|nr:hypothetical protein F511_41298 [Dorcoceras hygrometricum]